MYCIGISDCDPPMRKRHCCVSVQLWRNTSGTLHVSITAFMEWLFMSGRYFSEVILPTNARTVCSAPSYFSLHVVPLRCKLFLKVLAPTDAKRRMYAEVWIVLPSMRRSSKNAERVYSGKSSPMSTGVNDVIGVCRTLLRSPIERCVFCVSIELEEIQNIVEKIMKNRTPRMYRI